MAKESEEEKEYTILSLICELNKVVDAHGDMPVYICGNEHIEEDAFGLEGFELCGKKDNLPKRVEFF